MVFIRKRYYIWLFRAYLKKWKNIILTSLLLGVFLFFILLIVYNIYIQPKLDKQVEKIGIAGSYTPDTLTDNISSLISYGLTKIDEKGKVVPGAATKWEIKDNGKKYIFYLNQHLYFHNGIKLTSKTLNLTFKDAEKKDIDNSTVSYTLKDSYSPFLLSVAKPILTKDFSGLGSYRITGIELNAGFLKSITIQKTTGIKDKKLIFFYPSIEALKIGFALGEVDKISEVTDLSFDNKPLSSWKNIKITKKINYNKLYTIFYNNNDKNLSDKKLRQALNYALPPEFSQGERAYSPIDPKSMFYNKIDDYAIFDIEVAKTFFNEDYKNTAIELSVQKENLDAANLIKIKWDKLGINTKIKIVNNIPQEYQILLYSFKVNLNPDQYTLWHSDQINNITHYNNKRIDKLLEDGRRLADIDERLKTYADFQKYLLADTPASFLYFPYEYTLERMIP